MRSANIPNLRIHSMKNNFTNSQNRVQNLEQEVHQYLQLKQYADEVDKDIEALLAERQLLNSEMTKKEQKLTNLVKQRPNEKASSKNQIDIFLIGDEPEQE